MFADFKDENGLRAEAEAARREGFTGKLAIHPAQVAVINAAFSPSAEDVSHAEQIVAAFEAHPDAGVLSVGGKMVDRPHLVQAQRVLERTRQEASMATTAERANTIEASDKPTSSRQRLRHDAPDQPLRPMEFERRALRPNDVAIKITHAGICHSDLHTCRNDWENTSYPVIPGHEIVGTVTAVGDEVTRHRVGDTVAVGCMVDSCMECDQCLAGWGMFCRKGCVHTYNSADYHDGTISKGGYTDHIVVRDHFVLKVPDGMDVSRVAPLLCAGMMTYPPLRQYDVGPTSKVAVVGLGGLGTWA